MNPFFGRELTLFYFVSFRFISYHFRRFNHTPVIMASGRELCYVLLTGVAGCYVMSFIILARPTVIRCACLRIGLGLCLSLCYSAIFVKTNRISRIFNCGVKAVSRPIYTSPISQIAICLCTWDSANIFYTLIPVDFFPFFHSTCLLRPKFNILPKSLPRFFPSLWFLFAYISLFFLLTFIFFSSCHCVVRMMLTLAVVVMVMVMMMMMMVVVLLDRSLQPLHQFSSSAR